jgi:hypothetical protein
MRRRRCGFWRFINVEQRQFSLLLAIAMPIVSSTSNDLICGVSQEVLCARSTNLYALVHKIIYAVITKIEGSFIA